MASHRVEAAIAARAAWLWLLGRILVTPLLGAAGADPWVMAPIATLIFVAVIGTLSWIDTRGQNEDLLLANLGTPQWLLRVLGFGVPLALEIVLGTIAHA